jgi:predicted double-glycine peptidase
MLRSSAFWVASVWTLLRKRGKFVQQTTRTDCGVASALTVLNIMGRTIDPVHAVDHMDPDRTGTSLETLRLYFEQQYGLEATALSVPADRVGEIKGQVILHMRQQHYVVLLRVSKTGVLVFDPSLGPVFYPPDDFAALYSGYLLQCRRRSRKAGGASVPAIIGATPPPRGGKRRGMEPAALFVIGVASRLLECAMLLCVVAMLFLVLNQASFPSLLMSFAVIVVCGALLLLTRQVRFEGEDGWIRKKQSRLWRSILRTALRGRDLHGFRGRFEKDVASTVRRGIGVTIPQRSQVPATLGAFMIMPAMLCLLSPILGLVHIGLYGLVLVVTQLDGIQQCRRSVRGGIGRYSKLTQGKDLINAGAAPELIGELAKWSVIGFAGFMVLTGALPPVALMFWILTAMQIVPIDFKRAVLLAPSIGAQDPVPGLTGTEVELRHQRLIGPVDLIVSRSGREIRIDGIASLTMTLQQPDLTVREQRLIQADVVVHAIRNLPEEHRFRFGPIRIFGPGQDASQADFEHLMIAKESRPKSNLPVPRDGRKTMDQGIQDPVLRDLHSCEPGDFPVFWDVRARIPLADLQERADAAGCVRVGHLTMTRLTVIKREAS